MAFGRRNFFSRFGEHARLFIRELEDGCPDQWYASRGGKNGYWMFDGWGLTTIWRNGEKNMNEKDHPWGGWPLLLSGVVLCHYLHSFCSHRAVLPAARHPAAADERGRCRWAPQRQDKEVGAKGECPARWRVGRRRAAQVACLEP